MLETNETTQVSVLACGISDALLCPSQSRVPTAVFAGEAWTGEPVLTLKPCETITNELVSMGSKGILELRTTCLDKY